MRYMVLPLLIALMGCSSRHQGVADVEKAATTLSLGHPVVVTQIVRAHDGGTVSFVLADTNKKSFLFCLDGQASSGTRGRLYSGAAHATREAAVLLPKGGGVEKAIVILLQAWVDKAFGKDQQRHLSSLKTVVGLSKDEVDAKTILSVIASVHQPESGKVPSS